MRRTSRLLAGVKPARFLEPNSPTGLTGLFTHASPRSTLIYVYSSTLEKLKAFPEDSVYRKSTEALTNHRLKIITAVKPAGYEEWAAKAKKIVDEHPDVFNTPEGEVPHEGGKHVQSTVLGRQFVTSKAEQEVDEEEWDGEEDLGPTLEGIRTEEERKGQGELGIKRPGVDSKTVTWPPEPPLDADQISALETQLGAGLIEEVIQVAEGELKLVDIMAKARVWEDLEEKPAEGQWSYFQRDSGAPYQE